MKIEYDKEYLRELHLTGQCKSKKYRFPPQVVANYIKRVDTLENIDAVEDLYPFKSLGFEALSGDKKGTYSIRINDQYRLEFTLHVESEPEPMIRICLLLDISNHYR